MSEPITVPGVYDIPAEAYHAERDCLTQSGAKLLLPPSCPAKFRHWRDNPQPPRTEFDLGHAAHREVLGKGQELAVLEYRDWRTKAAQEDAAKARSAGKVPLLAADWLRVQAMARALRTQVPGLFGPDGHTEQVIVWNDDTTGVTCKAMLDWWRRPRGTARAMVVDYKTCADASPGAVARALHTYGYHIQRAHYLDGIRALGIDERPAMVFVFQEKEPPYLVNVIQADPTAVSIGEALIRQGREVYRDCLAADLWPGYHTGDVPEVGLPRWAVNQHLYEESS